LPWRTVAENLRFIFKEKSIKKAGPHDENIKAMLELVGLTKAWHLYPHELSGGMRQRVAIARAFLHPSELLLMDEPFSSLDFNLKCKLMDDFYKIWEQDRRTVIFVSHDEIEIRKLSQVILTFSDKPVQIISEEIV
jgi:NitT/TauT family transport system ATP-binding protein